MPRPLTSLTLALASLLPLTGVQAATSAEGQLRLGDDAWTVADAIVFEEDGALRVTFSDTPFDRAALLADGRVDGFDLMRHHGNTVQLVIRDGQPESCLHLRAVSEAMTRSGSTCRGTFEDAMRIDVATADRVAGRMQWDNDHGEAVTLRFDVAPLVPPTSAAARALPADGGEPGAAYLAHLAIVAAGDWAALKAAAPPDRRALMEMSEADGEHIEMFELVRMMTPRRVRITGGSIDGEFADVDYVSEDEAHPGAGSARLRYTDGRWILIGSRSDM